MDGHQRMGTYLAGSGVCCALIPSVFSSPPRTDAILGDNWENAPPPTIYIHNNRHNKRTHAHTHTHTHTITRKQTTFLRRRNRDRAGVTERRVVWRSRGTSTRFPKQGNSTPQEKRQQAASKQAVVAVAKERLTEKIKHYSRNRRDSLSVPRACSPILLRFSITRDLRYRELGGCWPCALVSHAKFPERDHRVHPVRGQQASTQGRRE